jgi:hypothetical protein
MPFQDNVRDSAEKWTGSRKILPVSLNFLNRILKKSVFPSIAA